MTTRTFIIAEAGVNHNGSRELARRLIDAARECGADAVKFQTFKAERIASRVAPKADYQGRNTPSEEPQIAMLSRLELGADDHRALIDHCRHAGITFLSSPFDEASADLLAELDVPMFKLASGEITNHPLLRHVAAKGRPILLSTGMSTIGEVERAVEVIRAAGGADLTLLHCVTEYPAPFAEVNLRAMSTMRAAFGLPVGYSDHTPGLEVSIAAVALGAVVIEKHLTLDRALPGPDHAASLEPAELRRLVEAIRHVESAMGNGIKAPASCELRNLLVARKSIVAARSLSAGHRLEATDISVKRPGTGLSPELVPVVLGRALRRGVAEDEVLTWEHLT